LLILLLEITVYPLARHPTSFSGAYDDQGCAGIEEAGTAQHAIALHRFPRAVEISIFPWYVAPFGIMIRLNLVATIQDPMMLMQRHFNSADSE
jgi:hypothetical protein